MLFMGVTAMALDESQGRTEVNGYKIIAPADFPPSSRPGDAGPTQTFEIIRPNNQGIMLSRLLTSCECIQLEAEKAYFADGERAFLYLRNVKYSPGTTYPFYVQISSPESMVLRYDAFVKSDIQAPN